MRSDITLQVAITDQHFEGILQLQHENLHHLISAEQQAKEGFVFAEHNLALLKQMASSLPQVIAVNDNKVVGYNLAMTESMQDELPSLKPMFEEFEKCSYEDRPLMDYKFIVGGQVCVAKNFRGHGLLEKLYRETAKLVGSRYQLCVTEISHRNPKSLRVHQKMGFVIIKTYKSEGEWWDIVAWMMS
jgi:hypothetical protein